MRSVSETRCEYVLVSSGPASMRGTVSETDLTARLRSTTVSDPYCFLISIVQASPDSILKV